MGRQVGFYAIAEDLHALLELAERAGAHALPAWAEPGARLPAPAPPVDFAVARGDALNFYLLPADIPPSEVAWSPALTEDGSRLLVPEASPVVQVGYTRSKEDRLLPGRIWVGYQPILWGSKSADKLYKLLSTEIRRWAVTVPKGTAVGPRTRALVESGQKCLYSGAHQVFLPG